MARYTVNVRAIAHLTQSINVEAASPEAAQRQVLEIAEAMAMKFWDVSDPEDIQAESVERESQ